MYLYTVWHKATIEIYTFSQTSTKNRKWLHVHSYRSTALIVALNRNFYYLHSALHKLSAVHVGDRVQDLDSKMAASASSARWPPAQAATLVLAR